MNTLLTRDGHLSELTLERELVGELQGHPQGPEVQAHLTECPLCRERHAALGADQAAFDLSPPSTHVLHPAPWFQRPAVVTPVLALAAAMLFFVYRPQT